MTYKILFNAMTTSGECVGTRAFIIDTDHPLNLSKDMCLNRLCVEYARLTGLKCSYADIKEVK